MTGLLSILQPFAVVEAQDASVITIEGRVQCLDAKRDAVPCEEDSRDFALVTDSGTRYFFSRDDSRSRIFQDSRVRERRLRIVGWLGEHRSVQITKVYSVKKGQLYKIYYYCPVCNITAFAGGPCWCCQQEFEFHETPVGPEPNGGP